MKYEDILTWWKNEKKVTKEDIYTLLDNFKILFAYHSGKIENDTITLHDTREIFENGSVINYTGDLRTLVEIKNQKDCFDSLVEKIVAKQEISLDLILELHRQLMKGCYDETRYLKGERPGEWKKHDYVTGEGVNDTGDPIGHAWVIDGCNVYTVDYWVRHYTNQFLYTEYIESTRNFNYFHCNMGGELGFGNGTYSSAVFNTPTGSYNTNLQIVTYSLD